jgi:signal transduction histidine kinase
MGLMEKDLRISAGGVKFGHKLDKGIVATMKNDELVQTAKSDTTSGDYYLRAMERLVTVVQELSLARTLEGIQAIVRHAARELTGADGATFVLRDNGFCYYADEEAIAPLWKGRRFPLETCVSGWAMLNRKPAVIEDIYDDPRIPADAYRPTFVKSLALVPIRSLDPVGAIGTYWATRRQPTPEEVKILQALANSTSVAMENVSLLTGLEQKVAERTARLQAVNEELDSFSHSVSHDLRAPLRHVSGFVELLQEQEGGRLSPSSSRYLKIITEATQNMNRLIDDLLAFSRMGRVELWRGRVDMNALVAEAWAELEPDRVGRKIAWEVDELPEVDGDGALLKQVWLNLLSNAIKYTGRSEEAEIRVGAIRRGDEVEFFVRDDGAGFEMKYADKLFGVFQRLHQEEEFAGTGIGLANVRRIVMRHGGRVRAEGEVERGATFYFAVPVGKQG